MRKLKSTKPSMQDTLMKNSVENYIKSLDENKNLIDNKSDTDMEYHRKYENYHITCRDINRKYDEQANQIKASNYEALKLTLDEERKLKDAIRRCLNV